MTSLRDERRGAGWQMDRRGVLKGVVTCLGGGATAGAFGGLVGCDSGSRKAPSASEAGGAALTGKANVRKPTYEPKMLRADQALTLEDLTEQIIPETDTPGAKRAGVAEFVEGIVRDLFSVEDGAAFVKGLDAVTARAKLKHSKAFHECSGAEQGEMFAAMVTAAADSKKAGAESPFFVALRKLTIQGFCQSKLGATRVLQYESVPGAYKACVPLKSIGKAWATR